MRFIDNIRAVYADDCDSADKGGIVENIIIIGGFAFLAIIAVSWISSAVLSRTADVAECIEGSNTTNSESVEACQDVNHSENDSFKNDSTYKDRYGDG